MTFGNKLIKNNNPLVTICFITMIIVVGFTIKAWANSSGLGPSDSLQTVKKVFYRAVNLPEDRIDRILYGKMQGWKPVDIRSLNPDIKQGSALWLKLLLPPGSWRRPELFLQMPVRNFEVYQGRLMIYKSRDGIHERKWSRSNLRAHFVHLLPNSLQQAVYIRLSADRFFYAQVWGTIKIGNQADDFLEIVRNDLADVLLSFILIFIALFLLGIQFLTRKIYLPYLGIGMYAFCNGVNFVAGLILMQLMWDAPTLRYYSEAMFYYLIPIGIILFVATFTDTVKSFRQMKPIYKLLILIFTLHAFLMMALDIAGVLSIYSYYNLFNIFFIATALFLISNGIQMGRDAKMDIKLILWGAVCSGLTGIHDILGLITGFFLLGRYVTNWGMLLFVIFMILFVVKRFIDADWELTSLNKTLEEQVMKRTEESAKANQDLDEVNDELHIILQNLAETQVQLVQSEKMALLGNLVAGVAHEINTPLGSIKSNVEMEEFILHELETAPPSEEQGQSPPCSTGIIQNIGPLIHINEIAINRIMSIVKNLTNFARPNEDELIRADLHEGLNSTLLVISHQLKGPVEVIKDYGSIPRIWCYPQQLNQVFLNLLINAVQAIKGKGRIVIQTRYADGKILIGIKDTGPGIPPENLSIIFQAGFTTKPKGLGTGLGLSISREIMAKHQGLIKVSSEPGQGAAFIIELPVLE